MQDPFQSAASNESGRISYLYLPDVRGQEGDEKLNEEGTKNRTKNQGEPFACNDNKKDRTHTRTRALLSTHAPTHKYAEVSP